MLLRYCSALSSKLNLKKLVGCHVNSMYGWCASMWKRNKRLWEKIYGLVLLHIFQIHLVFYKTVYFNFMHKLQDYRKIYRGIRKYFLSEVHIGNAILNIFLFPEEKHFRMWKWMFKRIHRAAKMASWTEKFYVQSIIHFISFFDTVYFKWQSLCFSCQKS